MSIVKDKVVMMNYTLKDEAGTVLDTSEGNSPLAYLHGHGQIIPGLESELSGKNTGDKLKVEIEPANAYGEIHEQLIQTVPRQEFAQVPDLEVGMQFQVDGPQGPMVFEIKEIKDTEVIIDGNHPLAGKKLFFDVEITEVRDATDEELAHGHAHGPGGAHHH